MPTLIPAKDESAFVIFPGLPHATVPTPVTFVPVPAFLGPDVCPVKLGHEDVTVKDPEPPAQIVVLVAVGTELTVIVPVAIRPPQKPVSGML